MQNYSQSVPAVHKAIAVLDHLRGAESKPTLTELSQALSVNRSTLLAILNTLRSAGLVSRDAGDRYGLGAGLAAFASAAAGTVPLVAACDEPARWLAASVGETTVVCELRQNEIVGLDFKAGAHAVGALPEVGRPYPAAASAAGLAVLGALPQADLASVAGEQLAHGGLVQELHEVSARGFAAVQGEREPGLVSLAAVVCDASVRPAGAITIYGPAYRLTEARFAEIGEKVIEAARRASRTLGCVTYDPYATRRPDELTWRGRHQAGLQGPELEAFLAQPWVASLACLNEQGYPYTVPVWYEWRSGAFWLVPRSRARWIAYLRLHPRVSLTISEPSPPFRRVLVEGRAEAVSDSAHEELADQIERRLAQRYLGPDAPGYLASGSRRDLAFRIEPEKVTTWEGLVAHPRYRGVA